MGENTSDDANIWVAASDGELEKVKQFLASGVDINAKDEFGYTPLQAAVSYNHLELVQYLLDHGASAVLGDNDMDTPLHMCESIECANLLLQRGAELNARNAEGRTPFDSAIEDERSQLLLFFESLGAEKSDVILENDEEDM